MLKKNYSQNLLTSTLNTPISTIVSSNDFNINSLQLNKEEKELEVNSRYGPPTDGGFGWVVVFASFMILFVAMGVVYTFGVFLVYYTNSYDGRADRTTLTFIGTLSTSLMTIAAVVTGRLADRFGYSNCVLFGGTLFSLGLLLASWCVEVWQLFLTQGLMVGVGASIMFMPAIAAPAQWFDKKRGLATGISIAGSGVGGLVLSPLTQFMVDTIDAPWALRVLAITGFIIIIPCAFLIRERAAPVPAGKFFDFDRFKDRNFNAIFIGGFIISFGYLVPFFLMPSYAKSKGFSSSQSSILISLLNGGSAIGRIGLGMVADRAGRLNVLSLSLFCTCLFCYFIWTFAADYGTLIAFNILYGISAGGFISLLPVVTAQLFGIQGLASTNGLLYFSSGIPNLIGTPIASAILNASSSSIDLPNYLPVIMYSGTSALIGSLFFIYLRFNVNSKLFALV